MVLFSELQLWTSGEPVTCSPARSHTTGLGLLVLTVTEPSKAFEILNTNANPPGAGELCKKGAVGTRKQRPQCPKSALSGHSVLTGAQQ